jgi:type I restriction enzyme R subunit
VNEADTCRRYVVPKLQAAGWENSPHSVAEQKTITDGRIVVQGGLPRRQQQKRVDYLLRYTRDFPIAVVEAKASYRTAGDGLQQAKDYASLLGLRFAYATNGHNILEFDFDTGVESEVADFPSPHVLWSRQTESLDLTAQAQQHLLSPGLAVVGKQSRYYQDIAINRVVDAIVRGRRKVLLTMATGTGKTYVAFQICWKLWSSRWSRQANHRRPRILFLADRNILVDDPYSKMFAPFGDARAKIEGGQAIKSREMYFAIYQAMAADERRPGLYREYEPDFFDLVIVDECHRGSARADGTWREILEYFEPAYQVGMTATPLRDENRDTYLYFGEPVYQYSLRQGIEDGFLAPYRVHRVVTTVDAAGWRPSAGDSDRYGRVIPDREYTTEDFERVLALRARTRAIAKHLTDFLKRTDRFGKTIVFCADQEHADEMRRSLANLNADLMQSHPDYVCRVTADEHEIGRGHLSRFQDLETDTPVILTTSQLLTTGVDAPMVRNVVLARMVGSMCEFKQIIGRGTRVRDDYGKLFFNIVDYTGSATTLFADPAFDGDPVNVVVDVIDDNDDDQAAQGDGGQEDADGDRGLQGGAGGLEDEPDGEPRKFYFDGGQVNVAAHLVYELDSEGRQLRVVQFTQYAAERVRHLFPTAGNLQAAWSDAERRAEVMSCLAERGVDFAQLAEALNQPEADPYDLLCHVAYGGRISTRRERVARVRQQQADFLARYSQPAREILELLLDKYTEHGPDQLVLPEALQLPPISQRGNLVEITRHFGSADSLRSAVTALQSFLYAV